MTAAAVPSTKEALVHDLAAAHAEPSWLLERRLDAWRAFEAMSMPSGLEEEWRRTDMSGFDLERVLLASWSKAKRENARLPKEFTKTEGLDGLILNQDGLVSQRYLSPRLNST